MRPRLRNGFDYRYSNRLILPFPRFPLLLRGGQPRRRLARPRPLHLTMARGRLLDATWIDWRRTAAAIMPPTVGKGRRMPIGTVMFIRPWLLAVAPLVRPLGLSD